MLITLGILFLVIHYLTFGFIISEKRENESV